MVDYSVKDAVRRLAIEFRQKHNAMDWSANIDQLLKVNGLASEKFSTADHGLVASVVSAVEWLKALAKKKIAQVKAMISIKEEVVFVADDLHEAKIPFAKGHELGHSVIPWHKEILYVCDEFDLAANARAQMEFEANVFSAEVLIPSPLLAAVYENYPTSMETVLLLKEWSGASIEACANQYVGNHPGKIILLVCEFAQSPEGRDLVVKRKAVSNTAARSALGTVAIGQVLDANHALCKAAQQGSIGRSVELTLGMKNSDVVYGGSVLNNSYRVLSLMYAKD
jgi:Zn-dependent peptidase ImmA (M78 family)